MALKRDYDKSRSYFKVIGLCPVCDIIFDLSVLNPDIPFIHPFVSLFRSDAPCWNFTLTNRKSILKSLHEPT